MWIWGNRFLIPTNETGILDSAFERPFGKPAAKEEPEIVDLPPVVIQLTTDAEKNSRAHNLKNQNIPVPASIGLLDI